MISSATGRVPLDHVTIAGTELAELEAAFENLGIEPEYGGSHDGLPTHMSIIGFEDETYIELIAKDSAGKAPYWDQMMEKNAGPCAWAIQSANIDADVERLRSNGIAVDDPEAYSRDRPDGSTARWKLAFPGAGDPGTLLPFVIEDTTPRDRRVQQTPTAAEAGIVGLDSVVIAVSELAGAQTTLMEAFETSPTSTRSVGAGPFAGDTARFEDLRVTLIEPGSEDPLAERIQTVGPSPCGFVLSATTESTLGPTTSYSLCDRTVDVIDPAHIGGLEYLAVVKE